MLQMMTELANNLFFNVDFQEISANSIKGAAGALGGLKPVDMIKFPTTSVLGALDTIKNNSNLSPKQV